LSTDSREPRVKFIDASAAPARPQTPPSRRCGRPVPAVSARSAGDELVRVQRWRMRVDDQAADHGVAQPSRRPAHSTSTVHQRHGAVTAVSVAGVDRPRPRA
jgi:hypothetical protein